jgi:nucleoside-diphosphate-sugar epimerase
VILLTGSSGSIGKNVAADRNLSLRFPIGAREIEDSLPIASETTLIHLAGISSIETVEADREASYSINVESTINLFKAFAGKNGQRFVFASSSHVYGSTRAGFFSSEQDELNPQSRYAEQKVETEQRLQALAEDFNTEILILRIFSVFGPEMRKNFLSGRIEHYFKVHGGYPMVTTADDIRDFSTPKKIGNYITSAKDIEVNKVLTLNLCSGEAKTVREQVISTYSDFPISNFVPGTSKIPRLVGDDCLMRKIFCEVNR